MQRPAIKEIESGSELRKWYWLKAELVEYCKEIKVNYSGSKFEILERIANGLDNISAQVKTKNIRNKSNFNWAKETLTLDTLITDSYTNGPNCRRFFKEHCGPSFHFSIAFMKYMKIGEGKSLQNAVDFWLELNKKQKNINFKSEIPAGNQYNQYLRDFFADNLDMTIVQARHYWKLKRSLPLEKHKYEKSDLDLE
jgi:Domain of unknown function (DUF6434)/SAP domain-containing new25